MRKKTTPTPLKLLVLGKAMRRIRIARGWSQRQLAERSSVSPRAIACIERGQGTLRVLTVLRIAKVLGTTAAELMHKVKL